MTYGNTHVRHSPISWSNKGVICTRHSTWWQPTRWHFAKFFCVFLQYASWLYAKVRWRIRIVKFLVGDVYANTCKYSPNNLELLIAQWKYFTTFPQIHEAITLLMDNKYYREAVSLARARLQENDQLVLKIVKTWAYRLKNGKSRVCIFITKQKLLA